MSQEPIETLSKPLLPQRHTEFHKFSQLGNKTDDNGSIG